MERPIRVLVGKPGLDGHDRGALIVAQGLRDAGMEVIYTGLRQTPAQIAAAAVDEDVDCVGLSSLSGAHMSLFPEVVRELRARGGADILVIGGGVIPREDAQALREAGIAEVFTPGSTIADMAAFIRSRVGGAAELAPAGPCVLDHVGIAVEDLEAAIELYTLHFGMRVSVREELKEQGIRAAFVDSGSAQLELLASTSDDSAIARFLATRGPGLHHLAYRVADIERALAAARAQGWRLVDERPRRGSREM
ncbi:MAG: VOC family protein, partial [Firmicutes bacterium]|nr:VOC family protein [Bacillota bacterium]